MNLKALAQKSWVKSMQMTTVTFPLGDIIAQYLSYGDINLFRVFYMTIIGALSGLFFHVYFQYVDRRFDSGWVNTKKVLTTEILFVPIYYIFLFVALAIFQGKIWNFSEYIRETYLLTYLAGQVYWLVVNVINFNLFSPKNRIKVMACAYLPWGVYLSLVGHLGIQEKLVQYLGEYAYLDIQYVAVITGISLVGLWLIFKDERRLHND